MSERRFSHFAPVLGGLVVFWICLVALFAAQTSMATNQDWQHALRGASGLWLPWIIVSPAMLVMAFLLPLGARPFWQLLPLHLVACTLILFAGGWMSLNIFSPPMGPRPGQPGFEPGRGPRPGGPMHPPPMDNLLRSLPVGLPLYVAAVLLVSSLNFRRLSIERQRQAAELEKQLAATRLETLRAQLQPHFLFNTLNMLTSLVHSDPERAEEMLLSLSNLLRATLEAKDKPLIPLRQELNLVRDYLAIQQNRFAERLEVVEEIATATLSCAIPPLLLQPILENAIKHAVERNVGRSRIRLRTERIAEKVVVEIEDTGAGAQSPPANGHGIGVANVRSRLAASYPDREVSFDLLPNEHGGITARLQLPALAA